MFSIENTVHDETGDGMVSYSFSDDDEKNEITALEITDLYRRKQSVCQALMISLTAEQSQDHIDRDDDLSDSYELDGTSVTIKQATDFAQDGSIRTMPIFDLR